MRLLGACGGHPWVTIECVLAMSIVVTCKVIDECVCQLSVVDEAMTTDEYTGGS